MTFLSAIAGESIFLLGAPGVAKSLVARRLKYAFENGKSFEYLMNRFSTPDEIFGPVSINKLKEDKYERLTDKYLPTSNVIFLDEIWKAGPSIQNALLTILNEKVYRNGDKEEKVDIRAIISASNELPEQNQGLEALWDRFLIRYVVDSIQNVENFNDMITKSLKNYDDNVNTNIKIKDDEYKQWTEKIDEIKIPIEVLNVIQVIRDYIEKQKEENKVYISDRRWRKIVRILRTSAFLNNRESVDLMDCFLIAHCIWNEPKQLKKMQEIVANSIKSHGYTNNTKSKEIKIEIENFKKEVENDTIIEVLQIPTTILELINGRYYQLINYNDTYCYILKSDFEKLSTDFVHINLFNIQGSNTQLINIKKENENTVLIKDHNYGSREYKMKTKIENIKEIKYKKPNDKLKKIWENDINKIKSFIGSEISKAENYRKNQLNFLHTNLFVHKDLSKNVEGNITNAINELQQLKLEVEKIKHYYETIK